MSLAPTIRGSGWLAKTPSMREKSNEAEAMACRKVKPQGGKNPVKPIPACKNLVVQVKIQAGLCHVLHT